MSQKKSVETTPDKQKNKRSAMVSHRMQQEVSKVRSKVQNYSDDGHESPAEYAEDSIRNTVDEVIYDTGHGIRQAIKGAVRKDGSSPADEHKPTGETVDSEVMPSPQQPYSAQRQAIMRNEQKTSVTHRKEQQREMIISESVANTQMDNTLVGAFKEVGSQFKDVGTELLGSLGFKPGRKKSAQVEQGPVKISKKCISCSAPLVGYKGKVIKCRYCDAEQTL